MKNPTVTKTKTKKTKIMTGIRGAVLFGALTTVIATLGCAPGSSDDSGSTDQAATESAVEQEADFVVLDRMGRPEMTNVTIGMGMREINSDSTPAESEGLATEMSTNAVATTPHVRAYNRQNVFHPKKGEREHARRILGAGIRALDEIGLVFGDPADWKPNEIDLVTDVLSEDTLVVDISKPCTIDTQSFFDIEREELVKRGLVTTDPQRPAEHTTCGGRTPNDDIIDDVLTMFINKSFDFTTPDNPRRVSDRIAKPTLVDGNTSNTFPYLGDPHVDAAQ